VGALRAVHHSHGASRRSESENIPTETASSLCGLRVALRRLGWVEEEILHERGERYMVQTSRLWMSSPEFEFNYSHLQPEGGSLVIQLLDYARQAAPRRVNCSD
jgi:hypothetical protein